MNCLKPPFLLLLFSGSMLVSCNENVARTASDSPAASETNGNTILDGGSARTEAKGSKTVGSFRYNIRLVNMLDFLEKKGERPEAADVASLEKQHLLFLEIESGKPGDIFDSKELVMSREEVARYLMARVKTDLDIRQGNETLTCEDVLYEGQWGKSNALRVAFLIDDLKPGISCEITYYDRITGNGLIKFSIKNR